MYLVNDIIVNIDNNEKLTALTEKYLSYVTERVSKNHGVCIFFYFINIIQIIFLHEIKY